ncbi:MAG TPA: GAF domain-containing protein, partial [Burkholderiaceae bacterium]
MKLPRWRLFPKYAMLITAVVAGVLVISGAINLVFSWRETQAQLVALQMEKAQGAAVRIEQYVLDIERQIAWTAFPRIDPSVDATEQRRFEYLKLQKQAPAITEMVWIGPDGRERLRMSRLGLDVIGAGTDWSKEPGFIAVLASMRAGKGEAWYGPVQFRKETEPYMAIARPAGGDGGVTLVDVNLKFVWDVVSRIKIGQNGLAYAVDATGTLIAHPDISLVLKHTDLSSLPQVAALAHPDAGAAVDARDLAGQPVFVAHARIPALNWTVFVESPRAEALAPLRESIMRLLWLLVGGLLLAAAESFVLARALVRPIRALQEGAARIGAGELDQRIRIKTGDELEGLAEQFNKMGAELQASYAGLERKVEERTRELRDALEQQTATAEVLQVISGSVADATPVFDKILESCERLFDCSTLVVNLIGDDSVAQLGAGGLLHLVAHRPPSDAQDGLKSLYPMRLGDTATEMAIRERRVLNFSDVLNGEGVPEGAPVPARLRGYSYSQMVAPLMWDERGIGSISVIRGRLGGFTQKECDLLKTFADQAVIAIQNSRLFNETKEALERQTATAEILRVISGSPTNVQPVLDTVAERSGALCRAEGSRVWLLQGGKLCAMTSYGSVYVDDAREALPLGRGSVAARAFVDRALVHVQDVLPLIDSEYPDVRHLQARYGFRTVLAVPMLREGESVGVIALLRNEVRPFSAAEIALVRAFADQAVIAIENVRLFNETKEALERQTATSEVLRVISESPADVQPVMDAVAERARLLCKAQGGRVWLPEGDRLRSITGYKLYKLDDGSDAG